MGQSRAHPPGAGDEDLLTGERRTLVEPADRAVGETGPLGGAAGTRPAPGGDGDLEQAVQPSVARSAGGRAPVRFADLVQHLVLADDGALQPGGDAEQVEDCLLALTQPQVRRDLGDLAEAVQLDPVAGVEHDPGGGPRVLPRDRLEQISSGAGGYRFGGDGE